MAEQSEPFVASEFSVTPGTQRLYKGGQGTIQVKMAQLQPEEFDQAPEFATWKVFVANFFFCRRTGYPDKLL